MPIMREDTFLFSLVGACAGRITKAAKISKELLNKGELSADGRCLVFIGFNSYGIQHRFFLQGYQHAGFVERQS